MAEPGGASLRRLAGLSLRLLWRDWRGGELGLLSAALLMAVTSVTGIALFTDRLEKALLLESAAMLAADRVVGGREAPPRAILEEGRARGLRVAETLSFSSMAFSDAGSLLVSAKAVGDGYPLRGEVIVAERPFAGGAPAPGGPPPGRVWLESRALSALGLEMGGTVQLGEAALVADRIIVAEPDRTGGLVDSLGPRLMLHLDDVPRTGVVRPGSRVFARYLFAADDPAALDGFEQWFRDNEDWRGEFYMRDIREESDEVADALARAENFLLLGSMAAVVLAGLAIALTAERYSERHYDYVAVMKTLGCTAGRILFIYLSIQLALALGAVALGSALGWLVHEGILLLLGSLVTVALPAPGAGPFLSGAVTALVCLLAFALPPLLALRETPPLRVLRRDLTQRRFGARTPYFFGMLGTVLLAYWHSRSLLLTGALVGVAAAVAMLLAAASWLLLRAGGGAGMRAGGAFKLAMTGIRRRRRQNVLQVMVFSAALMSLLVLTLLRTDLIDEWRAQLPEDAPNHFLMNITSGQIDGIRAFFEEHGVGGDAFYPLVRARVTHVNGAPPAPRPEEEEGGGPVETADGGAPEDGADGEEGRRVRGGLGWRQVTWETALPPDNLVTAGRWWGEDAVPGYVSVERDYAGWLDLELGDELRFEVNRREVVAEVSSFRSVRWDNMRPNFFIIFSPGTIDRAGATYLSTALLAPEQKELLNELVRRFPTVVVLEIDALIRQIRDIVAQVTSAIELISALVLLCGALVLVACVNASLDERFRESAVLRTLGAGRRLILGGLLLEFAALGLAAGLIAAAGAEALLYFLQREMFEQEFSPHRWAWLAGPALGMLIIAGLGVASARGAVNSSPLRALRRTA